MEKATIIAAEVFEVSVCAESATAPWEVFVHIFDDAPDDDCSIWTADTAGLAACTHDYLRRFGDGSRLNDELLAEIVRTFHYAIHKNAMERRAA